MSDHILVLHPADPWASVNAASTLVQGLTDLGLLGEPYHWHDELRFRQGRRFLKLVNFARSHSVIILGESDGGLKQVDEVDSRSTCHLSLSEMSAEPEFIGGANTLPPLCPTCTLEADDPYGVVGDWLDDKVNFRWECPRCRHSSKIHELEWRQTAGFGRLALRVWDVWHGEARPSEELMARLSELTQEPWTYFYYHL